MMAATLLEAQITSRIIDHTARWLRAVHALGHYTIGSAGHEANALVALSLEPTDPALLHYRSGGFYVARSLQAQHQGTTVDNPADDILRGMLARSTEPIAGGRHKVFGHHVLSIIPQTSTIASHLPRAVGLALSFDLANDASLTWPVNSVVVCSFGDASLNHSTAQGAINWASNLAFAGRRVPVLFVCEDNGLGLSVPTDPDWVAASVRSRPAIDYTRIAGTKPSQALTELPAAIQRVRDEGRPGFVHLETVRYLGHAGTDVEAAYRSPDAMRTDLERDPILFTAQLAMDSGVCDATEILEWYHDLRSTIRTRALELADEPTLTDAAEVMEPLTPMVKLRGTSVAESPSIVSSDRLTLAQSINRTLGDLLTERSKTIVFGEDVGRKGGVYGVTRGLQKKFGDKRVFDTVLDEQSVLGLALGSSLNGFLPLPEIQYLAYLHNAEDQLRGEAATLAFFSKGQYVNPMVIRVAAYGYQKGFGGHFHNDNSIAVLRDIPGVVIASPAHPADAGPMLRACVEHAASTGAVCVYLEPIALYHTTDLQEPGDQEWTADTSSIGVDPIGGRVHGDGNDLTILTWANGVYLSRRAAKSLSDAHGINVRILDLRWLAPLPLDQMLSQADITGRVLVVDETRRSGGVGEGIVAELVDAGFSGSIARIAGKDSFIPLGAAANHVLLSEEDIIRAARNVARTTTAADGS
ncbi:MAG: MFS transporter [Acidimicrobiales bacterium]|nr:MFS transporter [Acidimicrobiales bacterium]